MDLILHIGSHKAGSTSLQSFLKNNQKLLEKLSFAAPDFLNYENNWQIAAWAGYPKLANYFINILGVFSAEELKTHSENFSDSLEKTIKIKKKEGHKKFIISSEALYSGCSNTEAIQKLERFFSTYFKNITVIFYYRPQLSLAKSAYAQLVKGPSMLNLTFGQFISTIYDDASFDYYLCLNKWSEAFGRQNIEIAEVSKSSNLNGNKLIKDFLLKVDVSFANVDLTFEQRHQNSSPNYKILTILRLINYLANRCPFKVSYNNKLIRGLHFLAKKLPLKGEFPTTFDKQIEDYFADSNSKLKGNFVAISKPK